MHVPAEFSSSEDKDKKNKKEEKDDRQKTKSTITYAELEFNLEKLELPAFKSKNRNNLPKLSESDNANQNDLKKRKLRSSDIKKDFVSYCDLSERIEGIKKLSIGFLDSIKSFLGGIRINYKTTENKEFTRKNSLVKFPEEDSLYDEFKESTVSFINDSVDGECLY